jgi:hypothetical protein
MKYFVFALVVTFYASSIAAQPPLTEKKLQQMVSNTNKAQFAANDSTFLMFHHYSDSATRVQLLNWLNKQSSSSDVYAAARSLSWKAMVLFSAPFRQADVSALMLQAINKAVESGDEYLVVHCLENYGYNCKDNAKPEIALFYFLKAAELRQQLDDRYIFYKNKTAYGMVGETLHQMQEFKQAIHYLEMAAGLPVQHKRQHISFLNTLGFTYQRLQQYDSSLYWYNKSMESAILYQDTVWQGIVSGNMGAVYFEQKQYNKALPLLWKDFYTNQIKERNSAGNTLHRIALIYLRQNKPDSALVLARLGFDIVSNFEPINKNFLRNANLALAEIYKARKNFDSAFYYYNSFHQLNDSLNQVAARNRTDVVQTRLGFEKVNNNISKLLLEKKAEKIWRYVLTAFIALLLIAAWFYIRWQRQQNHNRQQQLLHQKQMAETEVKNEREKLQDFTQHIIDKNELIEKLQAQLQRQNMEVNEALLNQSILTENDWLRFKDMFEKANPGFFKTLQQLAPDITTAELRLAALLKLNLGNKHIAAMLGVGADAVRKTKSRLRQRMQLVAEDGLEDYIRSIQAKMRL